MKKSPFSTPRGYGGHRRHSHQMASPYENRGYSHQMTSPYENRGYSHQMTSPYENRGYSHQMTSPYENKGYSHQMTSPYENKGYSHQMTSPYENKGYYHRNNSFNNSPKFNPKQVESSDFIPFNTSSPSFHNKRFSGPNFTPRGRRNNYSFGSQGSWGENMSPKIYMDSTPTNYYNGTPRHRTSASWNTPIDKIPISEFMQLKDSLENPWTNLMGNHQSRLINKLNASKISSERDLNNVSMKSTDNSISEDSSRCSQKRMTTEQMQ